MPSAVLRSIKVTVPVGRPEPPLGVTVAMKVTLSPALLRFFEDLSAVIVPVLGLTVCVSILLLPGKFGSPP